MIDGVHKRLCTCAQTLHKLTYRLVRLCRRSSYYGTAVHAGLVGLPVATLVATSSSSSTGS